MNQEHPSMRVTILRHGSSSSDPSMSPSGDKHHPTQSPLIDIHESAEGLILEADIPGVRKDDVLIQLSENVLTLFAKIDPSLAEGFKALHEEFPVIDYHRSFILSDEVDREQITAELNGGVLRLTLPKGARSKPRRIEIKSS